MLQCSLDLDWKPLNKQGVFFVAQMLMQLIQDNLFQDLGWMRSPGFKDWKSASMACSPDVSAEQNLWQVRTVQLPQMANN